MKRLKLHLRIAKLRLERWAIARLWTEGSWVDREDALEDVDAEIRDLRFQLRQRDEKALREAAKASARAMSGPEDE